MNDIEILESFIKQLEEFEDEEELKQAIENLINRLNELTNSYNQKIKECNNENKRCAELAIELQTEKENVEKLKNAYTNLLADTADTISKDKIKEIIKELDKRVTEPEKTNWFARLTIGEALSFKHFLEQELLEE